MTIDRDSREKLRAIQDNTKAIKDLGKIFAEHTKEMRKLTAALAKPKEDLDVTHRAVYVNDGYLALCKTHDQAFDHFRSVRTTNPDNVSCLDCRHHPDFIK